MRTSVFQYVGGQTTCPILSEVISYNFPVSSLTIVAPVVVLWPLLRLHRSAWSLVSTPYRVLGIRNLVLISRSHQGPHPDLQKPPGTSSWSPKAPRNVILISRSPQDDIIWPCQQGADHEQFRRAGAKVSQKVLLSWMIFSLQGSSWVLCTEGTLHPERQERWH